MAVLHPRLSVSAISSFGWTFEQDLAFWRDAGITLVGAALHKVVPYGADQAADELAAAGIAVANVVGSMGFHLDQPERWEEERAAAVDGLDVARRLGSPVLSMTPGPPGVLSADEAAEAFVVAVDPVLDAGVERGVRVAFEHTTPMRRDLGFVTTLADAVELAERADLGVCVELNNAWVEMHLDRTIARGVGAFAFVQVSDAVAGSVTTPDRAVPGDGDIPLESLLGRLLEAGYQGTFDLEVIGPRIEQEGYASAIGRGATWVSAVLTRLGA